MIPRIRLHSATVVGAGYVGLPLAVEKGKVGFRVICIDQNPRRVLTLKRGENYLRDVKDTGIAGPGSWWQVESHGYV